MYDHFRWYRMETPSKWKWNERERENTQQQKIPINNNESICAAWFYEFRLLTTLFHFLNYDSGSFVVVVVGSMFIHRVFKCHFARSLKCKHTHTFYTHGASKYLYLLSHVYPLVPSSSSSSSFRTVEMYENVQIIDIWTYVNNHGE